jgi:hypothetical protein
VRQQIIAETLNSTLKPLCPRDNHVMHYEPHGITWPEEPGSAALHVVPSYHCNYFGCSVRYIPSDGYFTVIDTPDRPHFVDEPGANILQCPRHGAWLYRSRDESTNGVVWRCGVEGCDYAHVGIS